MRILKTLALSLFATTLCPGNLVASEPEKKDIPCITPDAKVATVTAAIEIPLSKIWAYNMPGTRDVRELEPRSYGPKVADLPQEQRTWREHNSITSEILSVLPILPTDKSARPRAGFSVQGKNKAVLDGAHGVLAARGKPFSRFAPGGDINVVFFAHSSGLYTHLRRVELKKGKVKIYYQFVSHPSKMLTRHFALVPLGQLPTGSYTVEMIQSPNEESKDVYDRPVRLAKETAQKIVCGSYSFSVQDRKKQH